VNAHVGYHYHAVTDCLEGCDTVAGHASRIGRAMDGYDILSHLLTDGTAPTDLDDCNGYETDTLGQGHHACEAGSKAILACLHAEAGCASEDPDRTCDKPARPPRP